MIDYSGKTILITGASSGIGKAMAEKLSAENCNLILIARRIEKLEQLQRNLADKPANIWIYKCDVGKKEEVVSTAEKIFAELNFIDIAILNSGVGYRVIPEKYNSQHAEETFGANIFGMIYWIECLLPKYLLKQKGMIVGVSSMADKRGYSGSGFYCASKAAATIYLEGLRIELKKSNIKVITVRPGFVKTPMTDKNKFKMPFLMEVEKAADIILKGIRKNKTYIQFPIKLVLLSKLVELIPNRLYEFLSGIQYKNERKKYASD